MAVIRISKRTVDAAPVPISGKVTYWDEHLKGFGLVVTGTGARSYVIQYRMGGGRRAKVRRYTLGRHGSPWTPDTARTRAAELLRGIANGDDPAAARDADVTAADADAAHFDFDAFADRYIEKHVVANGLRSRKDIEETFDRDLRPHFCGKSVRDITKDEVKAMRTAVGGRSRSAANKAHKWLSGMYSWGLEHDRLDTTPMVGLKRPFPEPKRTRFLVPREIRSLATALLAMNPAYRLLVMLLLLTGVRLREMAMAKWEEFDEALTEWIVPAERTKNKLPHLVPISAHVRSILLAIAPDGPRKGYVLTTNGRSPVSGFSKWKAELDEQLTTSGTPITDWVIHDLRRTLSTTGAGLGMPPEHVEAVLNHVSGTRANVAGTYNVYKYRKEKTALLRKWGAWVEKTVGTSLMAKAAEIG